LLLLLLLLLLLWITANMPTGIEEIGLAFEVGAALTQTSSAPKLIFAKARQSCLMSALNKIRDQSKLKTSLKGGIRSRLDLSLARQ
jgi:hypothetical protein